MAEEKRIDMKSILVENGKRIEEIRILVKTEPLQALEKIEKNLPEIPMGLVELVDELKKSPSKVVREKAEEISKRIWDLRASMVDAIVLKTDHLLEGMESSLANVEFRSSLGKLVQEQQRNFDLSNGRSGTTGYKPVACSG